MSSDKIQEPSEFYQCCSSWCWENNIKNEKHFFMFKKINPMPDWMPGNPKDYFTRRREWVSEPHFFDGQTRQRLGSYERCKEICQQLNIRTKRHFQELRKKHVVPYWVPSNPSEHFGKQWTGWDKFLGKEKKTYQECRDYCKEHKIKSGAEYFRLSKSKKLPLWMPSNPSNFFTQEWTGWLDFLCRDTRHAPQSAKLADYHTCSSYCKYHNIKSKMHYIKARKAKILPDFMPADPSKTFNDTWVSWMVFLGTNTVPKCERRLQFSDYDTCSNYCKENNITTIKQYKTLYRNKEMPIFMPSHPYIIFKNQWISWPKFLQTNRINNKQRSEQISDYDTCSNYCKENQIMSERHYLRLFRSKSLPIYMPGRPNFSFVNNWLGWNHFLQKQNNSS